LNPKETYFLPFSQQNGYLDEPGQGRKTLGQQAATRYDRIKQLCQEDIATLEYKIEEWFNQRI
jgi:hypothetical protein